MSIVRPHFLRAIYTASAASVFRARNGRVSFPHRRVTKVVDLSPVSADLMRSFDVQGAGLSAMLFVFFVGRLVIDAVEYSITKECRTYDSDDSDDE
jgi:hypothetical protein